MSKKARRRPSWGKYRQKYGKIAVYYQRTKCIHGLDAEEELAEMLYENYEDFRNRIDKQFFDYIIGRMTGK